MVSKTRAQRITDFIADLPSNVRTSVESAWRGRERGLAIVAGVFLASLVITTVLAYGNGLSQTFLQTTLEGDVFDAKVEQQASPPVPGVSSENSTFTNDSALMVEVCEELSQRSEIADCSFVFGRQAIRTEGNFNNIEAFTAGYLAMESVTSENPVLENETFDFPEADANGPPIFTKRMVRLLGPGAFDGALADRHDAQMLNDIPWPSHQDMIDNRSVILPASLAGPLGVQVNDTIDSLQFSYVIETVAGAESIDDRDCEGYVERTRGGVEHCRLYVVVDNLNVSGIYEDWAFANPTFGFNPIFMAWSMLDNGTVTTLMDSDHGYLGVAVDRSLVPTSSTADAEDWISILRQSVMYEDGPGNNQKSYGAGIELFWFDTISGSILFIEIFLGLIQTFDYILMIPIIILSVAILVYGLILSLEQRRREIAIHRTIGGSASQLQSMVLREVFAMSFVAWLLGYILAIQTVGLVLSAVGFMSFEPLEFPINVKLGTISLLVTAFATIGAALLFGRGRTKEFLELEIDEGVRKVPTKKKQRTGLQILMFSIGILAVVESRIEDTTGERGLIENFFVDGLLGLFGPFLLWIGGALILGRIAAFGPRFFSILFGWTPLLKDIRRGLKGGGSSESIGRLATIMVLTLSIVTLAAVQGATGTLVDDRTAESQTGSVMSVQFDEPMNKTQVNAIFESNINNLGLDVDPIRSTAVNALTVATIDGSISSEAWVVLDGHEDVLLWTQQSIPGDDISQVVTGWSEGGFTAGAEIAFSLRLPGAGEGSNDEFEPKFDEDSGEVEVVRFISNSQRLNISTPDLEEFTSVEALGPIFAEYNWKANLSHLDLSAQDMSDRELQRTNFTSSILIGTDLSDSNLRKSVFFYTSLVGANLSGADLTDSILITPDFGFGNPLEGANLSGADMTGMFGMANLSGVDITDAICPDGTFANVTGCATGLSPIPPSQVMEILQADIEISIEQSEYTTELNYLGQHEYLPGQSSADAEGTIIIGESAYRTLSGLASNATINATEWYIWVGKGTMLLADINEDDLTSLRFAIEANDSVTGVSDLSSNRELVERNGGLIFGTPGLLSLQFVVAALGSVASAFVFLSLVLSQRKREMAILQAIGASPNQVMRLVLFEILAIVISSMALGLVLGAGVAQSFNGFFSIFGFIFQIFGGASTVIDRELVWPWFDLAIVSVAVLSAVLVALTTTTFRALRSDLAVVLKGE